ncbi:hypothetical protein ACOMHN_061290 [Nucella lapillus]
MATRYLTALDYSDLHTSAVLRKHAKKRPLGELESRYQFMPPQPVLSCRTVDIDVSGTRTYRPRSTVDILEEQHKLIRKLFRASGRSAASAPPRRSSPRKGLGQVINGNATTTTSTTPAHTPTPNTPSPVVVTGKGKSAVHVQGRPCTSMSQNSEPVTSRHRPTASGQRPKTTGRLKNVKLATETFLANDYDEEEILETRRSHSELTSQIHAYWRPDSGHLNQGHFMRGQKRPDDVPPTLDAWLTFGGVGGGGGGGGGGEESSSGGGGGGVVDAFASFQSPEDYYNIEGSVGSRVAQQLQKGDKIRIGINGEVFTHDLKVKKWGGNKDQEPRHPHPHPRHSSAREGKEEEEMEEQEEDGEEESETAEDSFRQGPEEMPSSSRTGGDTEDFQFGEVTLESLDQALKDKPSGESRRPRTALSMDLPLSWEDQVSRPEVKVIRPRPSPRDRAQENLCETHPVVFNRVVRSTPLRPRLASGTAANSYTLKHRTLPPSSSPLPHHHHQHADPRADGSSTTKVKTLTFNPNSLEDEQRLSSISVDDVIQKRLEKTSNSRSKTADGAGAGSGARAGVGAGAEPSSNGPALLNGSRQEEEDTTDGLPRDRKVQGGKHHHTKRSASAASKASSKSSGGGSSGKSGKTHSSSSPSGRPLVVPRPSSSMPTRGGARDKDLGLVAPAAVSLQKGKGNAEHPNSERPTRQLTALPMYRGGLGGSSSISSINAGPIPGDTEFIQISQPICNPHAPLPHPSTTTPTRSLHSLHSHPPIPSTASTTIPPPPFSPGGGSITPESGLGGHSGAGSPRTVTPNNALAPCPQPYQEETQRFDPPTTPDLNPDAARAEDESRNMFTPVSDSADFQPSSAVKAISIPTGDRLEDDEDEELTALQRRERSLRDQHIEQITNLLEGAILS